MIRRSWRLQSRGSTVGRKESQRERLKRERKKEAHLEVELRDLRSDEDKRNVAEVLNIPQSRDDLQRVDEDGVEVACPCLVEQSRFVEVVDDGDLEAELLDRLDDTRVVMQRVDEEDVTAGVRDEGLLTDLLELPLADLAADARARSSQRSSAKEDEGRKNAPLNGEVELRTSAELRGNPKLSSHKLDQSLRDSESETGSSVFLWGVDRR